MSAATDVLWVDNTNMVWIDGLRNDVNGSPVNDATCVIVEVLDASGTQVPGTANIAMTYKGGSEGDYYGPLPHTVSLTDGAEYTVHARAVDADGNVADWRRKVRARYRNDA